MKILIISHGDFAAGMCSTLRTFFGADNVYSACVTPEGGTGDMMETARRYLEDWGEEQVVICSDLKCGSANQTAYPLIARPNTFLVAGVNLSVLLQLQMEDHVTVESLQEILDNAREDLVLMNALVLDADCEEDE